MRCSNSLIRAVQWAVLARWGGGIMSPYKFDQVAQWAAQLGWHQLASIWQRRRQQQQMLPQSCSRQTAFGSAGCV
jgi:hypothetical protein